MVNVKFQLFQPNYLNIKSPPCKIPWLWPHTLHLRKITWALTYCFLKNQENDSKIPSHTADNSKVHDEYKSDNQNTAVSTDVTLYTSVNRNQQFRGACCLQHKCRSQFSALQMEAGGSSKIEMRTSHTTQTNRRLIRCSVLTCGKVQVHAQPVILSQVLISHP